MEPIVEPLPTSSSLAVVTVLSAASAAHSRTQLEEEKTYDYNVAKQTLEECKERATAILELFRSLTLTPEQERQVHEHRTYLWSKWRYITGLMVHYPLEEVAFVHQVTALRYAAEAEWYRRIPIELQVRVRST